MPPYQFSAYKVVYKWHKYTCQSGGCQCDYKANLSSQLNWHWNCQPELSLAINCSTAQSQLEVTWIVSYIIHSFSTCGPAIQMWLVVWAARCRFKHPAGPGSFQSPVVITVGRDLFLPFSKVYFIICLITNKCSKLKWQVLVIIMISDKHLGINFLNRLLYEQD